MNVYRGIHQAMNANASLHAQNFGGMAHQVQTQMQATPGGRLMLQHNPQTFQALFSVFVQFFQGMWTWNPGAHTPAHGALLDGAQTYGQCLGLSRELCLLATAPAPYGLGLSPAHVVLTTYKGQFNNGFVSRHPVAGAFSLRSNVEAIPANAPGAPPPNSPPADQLYFWCNHVVVQYQGRYYDPSYGLIYNTLAAMAEYHVQAQVLHKGHTYDRLQHATTLQQAYFLAYNVARVVGGRTVRSRGPYAALP